MSLKKVLFFFLFFIQISQAMIDQTIIKNIPQKNAAFFSHKHKLLASTAKWLKKTPNGSKIYIANNFFTHDSIQEALVKAKKQGALINVLIDQESFTMQSTKDKTMKNLFSLYNKGIDSIVYNFNKEKLIPYPQTNLNPQKMHMKLTFWKEDQSNNSNSNPKFRIISSTANISTNAEDYNWEHMTIIPNNHTIYLKAKKFYKNLEKQQIFFSEILKRQNYNSLMKSSAIITPKEDLSFTQVIDTPSIFFSPKYNLVKALTNFINSTKKNDSVYISCYCINDQYGFSKALINAAKRKVNLKIIIDKKCAANQFIQKNLYNIDDTCELYITNKNTGNNHHKFIIANINGAQWIIEGSCNFTYTASSDVNELIVHKNDSSLFQNFSDAFNQTYEESISFKDYLNRK